MQSVHQHKWMTGPVLPIAVLLAAFGVILGCAVGAGDLLKLVERPDGSTSLDSSITSWMVDHRTSGLTTLARLLSTVGSQAILLPLTAVVGILLLTRRQFVPVVLLFACWGGALGLYSLTKLLVQRPRPPMEIWLTKAGKTAAFPSGHATQSMGTFVALALVGAIWLTGARRASLALAVILALGVGWSRVYLGVHWSTDVLAGWLIASVWVTAVVRQTARVSSATRSAP